MQFRPTAALVAFGLLLAACGGEAAARPVASLESTVPGAPAPAPGDDEVSMEDGLIAFTECLREQGIEVGDPSLDPDGNLQMPPIEFDLSTEDEVQIDAAMERMDAVFAKCERLLGEVAFTGSDLPDIDEFEDLLLEYAACMRDHGVDVPDPDLSGHASLMVELAGDPTDPDFQAADEACRSILAGFDPMG